MNDVRALVLFFFLVTILPGTAQDLSAVFIPEEWTKGCSVLNGIFQINENEYCVYGRRGCNSGAGFWAIVKEDRSVIRFVDEGEANSIIEGYQKGDSLIFVGIWDATDVLPEMHTLRIPYHLEEDRGAHTRINHVFTVDNGLVFDPVSQREWIVTQYRVCEIKEGRADTVLRLAFPDEIISADAYEGVLYLAQRHGVWDLGPDGTLSMVYNIPNIRSLSFDEEGGVYILAAKWLYYADSIGATPRVVQNFNEVRGTPFTLLLNDDGKRGDTAALVYTSQKEPEEIEGTGVIFSRGQPIDTLKWRHPSFQLYQGVYTDNGVIGVGTHRVLGSMYKSGILWTNGDISPSGIDLAINVQIDTSYWQYDTTPRPSVVKAHKWDYTVTLTNLGNETVHFGDVFSPTAFSAWFFEFREYCGFDQEIRPGDSIEMQCEGQAHLYDQVVGTQCMAVDAIDTYLDKDYSNNIACAEIPRPIGVGTDDIPFTEFSVYPNPGNGLIMHGLDLEDPHDLWVFDVNGKMYRPEHVRQGQIDLSGLPAGVYTILVQTREQTYRASAVIIP
jgi:hypothetical protein